MNVDDMTDLEFLELLDKFGVEDLSITPAPGFIISKEMQDIMRPRAEQIWNELERACG